MGGNVMEWVNSQYTNYPGSPKPFTDNDLIINRGGSWGYNGKDQLTYSRSRFVFPGKDHIYSRWHDAGCRLARNI